MIIVHLLVKLHQSLVITIVSKTTIEKTHFASKLAHFLPIKTQNMKILYPAQCWFKQH